jgi:MtN3 and saliva related transmembrane protein
MENDLTETIGFLAAAGTTFAFVPQAIRVWRRRSAEDISLAMYLILVAGVILWIVYGALIHSKPLVAANVLSLLLAGAVLAGKLRFKGRRA